MRTKMMKRKENEGTLLARNMRDREREKERRGGEVGMEKKEGGREVWRLCLAEDTLRFQVPLLTKRFTALIATKRSLT